MKKLTRLSVFVLLLLIAKFNFSQGWQDIHENETLVINGLEISYITSYIKQVKGQDVYTITATITNNGPDITYLFREARYHFNKEPRNSWAHFRFTNATGKGLSNREGHLYPDPITMRFPYKCNDVQEKEDYAQRIIGVGLQAGRYKTHNWRVRVNKGEKVSVKVLLKSTF